MEKVELKRFEAIELFNSMNGYVQEVGKKNNTLAWNCNNMLTYEPNSILIEAQNKKFAQLQKNYERLCKKVANKYASTYSEGDKKGTFILDENQDFIFTPENQSKLEDEVCIISDEYEASIIDFRNEVVSIYIDKVTDLKIELSIQYQNSLALILE